MRRSIRLLQNTLATPRQLDTGAGYPEGRCSIQSLLTTYHASSITQQAHQLRPLHLLSSNQPAAQQRHSHSGWAGQGSCLAAAVAASGLLLSAASLDALADAGPSGQQGKPLEAAQASLAAQWQEVSDDLARANASLPRNMPEAVGKPPYVQLGSPGHPDALIVHIPIRNGADPEGVIREALSAFSASGGNRSQMRSMSGDGSQVVQMEVHPTTVIGGPRGTTRANSRLLVRVSVPPAGAQGEGGGEVVIEKVGPSGFSPTELEGMGRLIRAANLTFAPDQVSLSRKLLGSQRGGSGLPSEVEHIAADLEKHFFRGLFGQFGAVMEEMQRQMESVMEGEEMEQGGLPEGTTVYRSFPGRRDEYPQNLPQEPIYEWGSAAADQAVKQLQSMGAKVYPPGKKDKMDWGVLAGYEDVKRTLEDCLLFPLLRPEVFSRVAEGTRAEYQSNRPRAVLFEGPPGTGKTTSARVIASQAAVPMIYVPLEAVLSKWFGESEHLIAKVFHAAEALGGAIIFIDELDSLGGSRDREMHEVSRRILSVLLREMEGFDTSKKAVVIGATNRKADLDAALLSRFDLILHYPLPDETARALILQRYAKQLSSSELETLAQKTLGLSGRDLRDVAEATERRWASKIIRGEVPDSSTTLPPLSEYLKSAAERSNNVTSVMNNGQGRAPAFPVRPRPFF